MYENKNVLGEESSKTKGHIMISYCYKYKNECLKINDELNKRGYKTWIDVFHLSASNNLHYAIEKAIQNASIVLICYSSEYEKSRSYQKEAEYAVSLKKDIIPVKLEDNYNPDGWLGVMLGSKIYVDFSKDIDSPVPYNNLFKQIDSLLNKSNKYIQQTKTYSSPAAAISNKFVDNPIDWNKRDVQNWLKENDLDSLAVVFQKFNGITLKSVWEMKQTDKTRFYQVIDKEIEKSKMDVDVVEKLNFYRILDTLFDDRYKDIDIPTDRVYKEYKEDEFGKRKHSRKRISIK